MSALAADFARRATARRRPEAAMMQLAWLWSLALLPLPLVLRRRPPLQPALWLPVLPAGASARGGFRTCWRRWRMLLAALSWLLLVLACARPQWLGAAVPLPLAGRDLLLAVDLSGSMETPDFVLNGRRVARLTALKAVAGAFIAGRQGDRLGLILFGDEAHLQAPLTFDRTTVRQLLDEAVIGLAGERTAIGDAIGLAVKRLTSGQAPADPPPTNQAVPVLVLFTDGVNTAGQLDPLAAARLAARQGVRLYCVGIGAEHSDPVGLLLRRRLQPTAEMDEELLRALAGATGGRYFRARDSLELAGIMAELDRLEPVESDQRPLRPITELYVWPLAGALLCALPLLSRREQA
ncbi:MAG: VWA domain-containing protein [Desulfuromonas thiophila]|nr:VWA domain-containing protein [Desulfuromonas thiophila]